MLIKREPAADNPWHSKSAEWQLPTPVPVHDFDRFPVFDADPYPYGVEPAAGPGLAPAGGGVADGRLSIRPHPSRDRARAARVAAAGDCGSAHASCAAPPRSSSSRSCSPTSTCARRTPTTDWKIGPVIPSVGLGVAIVVVLILSALALRVAARRPELTVRLGGAAAAAGAAVGGAPGDRLDDAGLRPRQRRLRERVRRLDGVLRGVRARLHLLDRDPGGHRLAADARGRAGDPRRGADRHGGDQGRRWRRARSSGRSTSPPAWCCSSSSTCSDAMSWRLVDPTAAGLRGGRGGALLGRRARIQPRRAAAAHGGLRRPAWPRS